MPKRSRDDSEAFFERLFAITNTFEPAADVNLVSLLKRAKRQVLSEDEEEEVIRKAAKEFTLEEAVREFALTWSGELDKNSTHWWRIEEFADVKNFQPSTCLLALLKSYTRIYDRSTAMAHGISPTESTEDGRRIPKFWDAVKVHCEVSFTHTINPRPTLSTKTIVQVGGRVDHGVGIVLRSRKVTNRHFYSLLLCIEAKFQGALYNALTQLVVYLACLRQSRINRGRSNISVYGVATDGLSYIFVTITHEGVLKESSLFNVRQGGLSTVLGSLRYILEMARSMSPNLTPEKGGLEADADDVTDLDDTPYLHHDDEENEVD